MRLDRVKLMTTEYRAIHLATLLGALCLLFTGVGSFPGSPKILVHDALGVSSIVVLVGYGAFLVGVHRLELFVALRKPISDQVREAKAVIRSYTIGTAIPQSVRRGMGRHNVLASYANVLLGIGFAQLMVSGVLLMILGPVTPLYETMLRVHVLGIGLTAIFILLHLFAVLRTENRPLLRAVFYDGKVSLSWAMDRMKGFLDKRK